MKSSTSSGGRVPVRKTSSTNGNKKKKLNGIRRRKWGKWVSEIRVPGTQERLWLGTYVTPEAAAMAHDVAVYCLRRPCTLEKLNFPETLSSYGVFQQSDDVMMSPMSVQKVASDVAMDVDARNIATEETTETERTLHHVISEIKTDDGHVQNSNVGASVENISNSSVWLEGLGDQDFSCWQGTFDQVFSSDEEALSISVEDYL